MPNHLLIVDDDQEIRTLLSDYLSQHHYQVSLAQNDLELFEHLENASSKIELIILDIMLPGANGLELCKQIRSKLDTPIIMLTAVNEDSDKILGLEFGADDYLAKPFNPRELLARIRSVLRRTQESETSDPQDLSFEPQKNFSRTSTFCFAGWTLQTADRRLLSPEEVEVSLSGAAYDLLLAFLERPQRVLTRDQLLDITRGRDGGPFDRSIDVQVSRLRQKLGDDPKNPQLIKTIRTGGYLFSTNVIKK